MSGPVHGSSIADGPRSAPVPHIASSDCERCRPGLIAQPVNTASSLAFVAVGAAIVHTSRYPKARRTERAVGWAAVAAGLGSVAYHGPGTAMGRRVHDASLLSLVGFIALADAEVASGRLVPASAVAAVPVLAALGAHPRSSSAIQATAGAAAVAGEVFRMSARGLGGSNPRARTTRTAEAVLAVGGALAHTFGRTGGPWCRPDSTLQPHAVWHVAMAGAVGLRFLDLRR